MTCWALKAERQRASRLESTERNTDDPSKPFFDRTYRP